ncbi:GNAT family N-acetyltransferase [Emergencia sp.]|uniref:GNAT family N-acetyltransferase n=1 Tax=Emergencia sp. TaxID=1926557 RepID=UPI003AF0A2F8
MDDMIRKMKKTEYPLLNDFLYEAIHIPQDAEAPPRSIINNPELQVYVEQFGRGRADYALAAEVDSKIVGAVWVRIMNDYGHIDEKTPSLAISLYKPYRGLGIGTALMEAMLSLLKGKGYESVSLSVQQANAAVRMYQRLGFQIVDENEEEYLMVKEL